MNIDKPSEEFVLLIVDDEEEVIQSLKRLFRKEHYTILTASCGRDGLEILKNNSVDLILSDQKMPGMSGIEFLALVREQFPNVIRMVLSGYNDVDTITAAINEGNAYKFILKPWNDEHLKEIVRDAIQLRILKEENERLNIELKKRNEELMIINDNLELEIEKRTERIIRQSCELKLAGDIMESIPVAVICIDKKYTIIFSNNFANTIFIATEETLIGDDIHDCFNDEICDIVSATMDLGLPQNATFYMHDIYQYRMKSTPITVGNDTSMIILSFYELD